MASFRLFLILAVLAAESLFLFLAEAIRSSQFQFQGPVFSRNGEKEKNRGGLSKPLPLFREAPEFRNGIECPKDQVTGLIPSAFPSSASSSCDTSAVHIAMTLDAHYLRGSMAAVLSVLQHASCPENVFFHFVIAEQDLSSLETVVKSTFPYLRFSAYPFEESRVKNLISESVRIALENPLNYARSYLAEILPECVQRVIYLDSDLIVIDDIAKLWNIDLGSKPIGAPEYCHAKFSKYFTGTFWSDENLSKTFQMRNPCYFNTGVMVIDLVKWRQNNYRQMIEQWMGVQRERRIYELGSLPPFLLVFAGEVKPVQHRWNQHGLGGDNISGRCRPLHPGPVSLLHWSGKGKPWLRLDSNKPCPMDALWAPYDLFVSANSQSSR